MSVLILSARFAGKVLLVWLSFVLIYAGASAQNPGNQPGNPLDSTIKKPVANVQAVAIASAPTPTVVATPAPSKPTASAEEMSQWSPEQIKAYWAKGGFLIPPPPPVGGVYDDSLPKNPDQLSVAPYQGERYIAEVPDTLDLVQYAHRSVNFLTRLISPEETDYCVYHFLHLGYNPAILEVGHMSTLSQNAKWSEAIVLMRAMSGNNERLEQDRKLIGSLVRITGKDGLCYHPVAGRPWAWIDPVLRDAKQPYSDVYCEGRQLRAYALWYAHDHNPLWKQLADRKTARLVELSWPQEGGARMFRKSRGFSPDYKETGEGKVVALGDAGGIYPGMTGDAAAFITTWPAHALLTWDDLTGNPAARLLADGLALYLYRDKVFYDAKRCDFTSIDHGHPTIFSHAVNGMCFLCHFGRQSGDDQLGQACLHGMERQAESSTRRSRPVHRSLPDRRYDPSRLHAESCRVHGCLGRRG